MVIYKVDAWENHETPYNKLYTEIKNDAIEYANFVFLEHFNFVPMRNSNISFTLALDSYIESLNVRVIEVETEMPSIEKQIYIIKANDFRKHENSIRLYLDRSLKWHIDSITTPHLNSIGDTDEGAFLEFKRKLRLSMEECRTMFFK